MTVPLDGELVSSRFRKVSGTTSQKARRVQRTIGFRPLFGADSQETAPGDKFDEVTTSRNFLERLTNPASLRNYCKKVTSQGAYLGFVSASNFRPLPKESIRTLQEAPIVRALIGIRRVHDYDSVRPTKDPAPQETRHSNKEEQISPQPHWMSDAE